MAPLKAASYHACTPLYLLMKSEKDLSKETPSSVEDNRQWQERALYGLAAAAPLALLALPQTRALARSAFGLKAEAGLLQHEAVAALKADAGQTLKTEAGQALMTDAALGLKAQPGLVLKNEAALALKGKELEIPPVFSIKSIDVDAHMAPSTRAAIASGSKLYNPELAASFAAGLREDSRRLFPDTFKAYMPLSPYKKVAGALDKEAPEFLEFAGQADRWQPVLNRHVDALADRVGMPRVKVNVWLDELGSRGLYDVPTNEMRVNYGELLRPRQLAETVYHEGTHAEQLNLLVRAQADKLGLPARPLASQIDELGLAMRKNFGIEQGFSSAYLDEAMHLRGGARLTKPELERSRSLRKSLASMGEGHNIDAFEDALFRDYLGRMPRNGQSFAEFLERNPSFASEMLDFGHGKRLPAVSRRFLADFRAADGDLSLLNLAKEGEAFQGVRRSMLDVLESNNRKRQFDGLKYRFSTHEVEAFENGALTYLRAH